MKNTIILLLLSFIMIGCTLSPSEGREEMLVSRILKSQHSIYEATAYTNNLLSSDILYINNYAYHDNTFDDILSLQLYIGDITLAGYSYDSFSMYNVGLDFDLDTLTQNYIYDYRGYIYDDYYSSYHFTTAESFVGIGHNNPYRGLMYIIGEDKTIVVDVIDAWYVDIAIYDHYDSYHDRVIHSSWRALGF